MKRLKVVRVKDSDMKVRTSFKYKLYNELRDNTSSDVEEITARQCSSEHYYGVDFSIYGNNIDIRAIIDFVAQKDGIGIETITMVSGDRPRVVVFIANIAEQEHPAFIN